MSFQDRCEGSSPTGEMELAVNACLESTRELRSELVATAKDQTNELPSVVRTGHELVTAITNSALTSSADALQKTATRFRETVDHIAEITKLSRHLAPTDNLRVSAKHAEINLKIYAPQVVAAAHTLAQHPSSKIAKENLEGRVALCLCLRIRILISSPIAAVLSSLPSFSRKKIDERWIS